MFDHIITIIINGRQQRSSANMLLPQSDKSTMSEPDGGDGPENRSRADQKAAQRCLTASLFCRQISRIVFPFARSKQMVTLPSSACHVQLFSCRIPLTRSSLTGPAFRASFGMPG